MALRSGSTLSALRAAVVGLFCLLLPIASWAHSFNSNHAPSQTCFPGIVCVFNQGGTAVGGLNGLTMDGTGGSVMSNVFEVGSQSVTGTLSFTTSGFLNTHGVGSFGTGTCSLVGGSCVLGSFAAGSLTITVNNWNGFSGTLFSGTFGSSSGGVTWQYDGKIGGVYQYALVGPINGTWGPSGGTVGGQTTQLFFTSKTPFTGAKGQTLTLTSGTTNIVTPEPANIGLLGTGLILMGFVVRRRARQQSGDDNKG